MPFDVIIDACVDDTILVGGNFDAPENMKIEHQLFLLSILQ